MRNKVIRMADFRQRNKITNQNQLNSFTLFLFSLYYEISKKSTAIPIILGITFPVRREEVPCPAPGWTSDEFDNYINGARWGVWSFGDLELEPGGIRQLQHLQLHSTGGPPGSFRSFVEFHPLIILYITTKITQKTTILTGISKLSQSILPSLSTCNVRSFQDTWASCVCQQEI